jgi:predicted ArsR family transcriptional regulator
MLPRQEISTRHQLLHLLKTQGNRCISDLSKALSITEMAVRRHIHTLERDDLVRSVLVRQSMGRPLYRYSLTEQANDFFPKNYPQLTLDLLTELEEQTDGTDVIDRLFQGRRDKLEARYRENMLDKPLADKVSELSSIQNTAGYMTDWNSSEEEGVFHLYEYNCPIAQVAKRYRQACHCEQQLFEQLLGANVERTECLADGATRCTYAISSKTNSINKEI